MNCCNEYGKCTQGKDCQARAQQTTQDEEDSDLFYFLSVAIAVIAAAAAFGFVLGAITFKLGLI